MIPRQKIRNLKIFSYHTPKNWYFWNEGLYFRRLFSQHPDQLERNSLDRRQRQHLFYLSTKNHPSSTSLREMGKESRKHSFQLIHQSDGIWFNHQLHLSYIAKNAEMSCKTPVTTCVTAFLRFAKPLQRYPLMGTCNFRRYLSTNTCYQNIP